MNDFGNLPLAERVVNVRSYLRYREGVWQTICAHIRRWPRRRRGTPRTSNNHFFL